jgi:hypothetical protein
LNAFAVISPVTSLQQSTQLVFPVLLRVLLLLLLLLPVTVLTCSLWHPFHIHIIMQSGSSAEQSGKEWPMCASASAQQLPCGAQLYEAMFNQQHRWRHD